MLIAHQMKMAGKFYYDEFLWLKNRHVPSMEEYRQIAFATSNMTGGIAVSLAGLGNDVITKAAFDWVSNQPEMVVSCLLVGRFQNDMVSHEVCFFGTLSVLLSGILVYVCDERY